MKFVDEYRDPLLAQRLVDRIKAVATREWTIMEVCGGQTHSLLRHGIDDELQPMVELIHGPGCPVCVTSLEAIDQAQQIAALPGVTLATFGDMLRVPGSGSSLMASRAAGARVRTVYSPLEAVQVARKNPDTNVVFFAVGFETTAPSTALAVLQAERLALKNFFVLVSHVRVLPAMQSLMEDPNHRIQGFLAAGHVCAVTGYSELELFAAEHRLPVAVTGFEPVDLLHGILNVVTQLESGNFQVANCYGRTVERQGNEHARRLVDRVYQADNQIWRGIGRISEGGYRLRSEYAEYDAVSRFCSQPADRASRLDAAQSQDDGPCLAGRVLTGQCKPCDCPEFGRSCTPDSPLGSPMVSSEGACAAYFRYRVVSDGMQQNVIPQQSASTPGALT
ncbi:MAG: hydrogenase formation protein HypD [Planctomycetota bacterium]